jgi:hypothetical protein
MRMYGFDHNRKIFDNLFISLHIGSTRYSLILTETTITYVHYSSINHVTVPTIDQRILTLHKR